MTKFDLDENGYLEYMMASMGVKYTEEQKELIKRFGKGPTFCFADPGTGKTHSAVGGLIMAETYGGIPGQNIYAMSFTRRATGELAVRHKNACRTLRMSQNVHFQTLHSLCSSILAENYRLLGMNNYNSGSDIPFDKLFSIVDGVLDDNGISLTPRQIRMTIQAVKSLNNSLIFNETNVKEKMVFKQIGIDYETFTMIRGNLFVYSVLAECVAVSDILLYTVLLILRHPEVSVEFKKRNKLMLIDEAQDCSLLQLYIISLLTDNPVFIGDMKQQIYGFNGACPEVSTEAHRLLPNMIDCKLTQSFRCANEIADFATKIILPNKIGGEDYKGIGNGGEVVELHGIYSGADIPTLAQNLHDEFILNRNSFPTSYMFLCRTNIGLLPVIEELYKQAIPFRTNSYCKAYEVPLIKEMCEILALCTYPTDCRRVLSLRYLIPEFSGMTLAENPYYVIMKQAPQSFFEVHYQFHNPAAGEEAMNVLQEITEMLNAQAHMTDILNTLWPLFYKIYVEKNAWKLDNKPSYYLNAVNALLHKTYAKFLNDETKKIEIIEECMLHDRGVRCYTMHASKGLESDIVYIIDADEGIIPNVKKLDQMVKAECHVDAARSVREERALCYVAATRAKKSLRIVTNGENMASILRGENQYSAYDSVYENYVKGGDDIEAFRQFAERFIPEL